MAATNERSKRDLLIAIHNGSTDRAITLLREGVNPNFYISNVSPLMEAILNQRIVLLQTLLEYDADINFFDPATGNNALLFLIHKLTEIETVINNYASSRNTQTMSYSKLVEKYQGYKLIFNIFFKTARPDIYVTDYATGLKIIDSAKRGIYSPEICNAVIEYDKKRGSIITAAYSYIWPNNAGAGAGTTGGKRRRRKTGKNKSHKKRT